MSAFAVLAAGSPNATAAVVSEGDVRFKVTCEYSHSLPDDPIVFPDQPGAAHLHDFFGREGVNASMNTYAELVNGDDRTTCNDLQDLAAYWVPALYADGVKVAPIRMTAYYRRGEKTGPIQAYPDGLRIIADSGGWQCDETLVATPLDCRRGELKLRVDFPDCWDGVNIDSADHRSHMAYAIDGGDVSTCPLSHPVPVPRLSTYVNYKPPRGTVNFTLSSGPASGPDNEIHGDFINGWVRARLVERIETCLNLMQRCDSGG